MRTRAGHSSRLDVWIVAALIAIGAVIGLSRSSSSPSFSNPATLTAENGSYYGQISDKTGRPKTVHVDSYDRRDGTHVRSHYRSRP